MSFWFMCTYQSRPEHAETRLCLCPFFHGHIFYWKIYCLVCDIFFFLNHLTKKRGPPAFEMSSKVTINFNSAIYEVKFDLHMYCTYIQLVKVRYCTHEANNWLFCQDPSNWKSRHVVQLKAGKVHRGERLFPVQVILTRARWDFSQ